MKNKLHLRHNIHSSTKTMLNLILFGPPGSGKGTQAAKLVERFNLVHISTGDLFRNEIAQGTPLGLQAKAYMDKGNLVPDEVTIGMLRNKIEHHADAAGFIFDGFPRTVTQAKALDALLAEKGEAIGQLIELYVDDEEIVRRIMARGASSGRTDDTDETIVRNRIQVYRDNTVPVAEYYGSLGKSAQVNGVGAIPYIFDNLCGIVACLV